jgi:hypothetical protein
MTVSLIYFKGVFKKHGTNRHKKLGFANSPGE